MWILPCTVGCACQKFQHCKCLATGVHYTKMATFIPLSKHLSFLAKIWTLLSSNECPLSFGCSRMAKSWPEELALCLYSGCLVSPMYRSILDSSVQWTTWPTLIYVSVFCPSGGTVSVCVARFKMDMHDVFVKNPTALLPLSICTLCCRWTMT